jgi:hypothetical protein
MIDCSGFTVIIKGRKTLFFFKENMIAGSIKFSKSGLLLIQHRLTALM